MKIVRHRLTAAERKDLWERMNRRCAYCGIKIGFSEVTADHKIPISRGGPDTSQNRVCCCGPCNALKADRTIVELDCINGVEEVLRSLPSAQPSQDKYEYHYDHTDCIWYRPEARNRCPVTCAQYRDGWNDAMNYIFRDGEGYRPFRRDKKYEG